jgi:hypothetical protein
MSQPSENPDVFPYGFRPIARKIMKLPPVTLRRVFDVIFSHVSPLQKAAILEDIEALESEIDSPTKPWPPTMRPAPDCILAQDHPPP